MSLRVRLRRLARDDRGASLVEYAMTVALFLALFFMLLDFGRLLYNWNMAEKAMQIAARMAAVRPAACPTVPISNQRGSSALATQFGDDCGTGTGVCQGNSGGTTRVDTCLANDAAATATATEIYTRIQDLLPTGATPANLRFSYAFDPKMNFLGGPYVPVVTAELVQPLEFEFVSPIYGLLRAAGATVAGPDTPANIPFPSMSVSLPGEDLALGENG